MYDTTERIIENNQVHLRGKMVTGFSFSHELLGEGFYTAQVTVDRLSEVTDTIPIMVSERLMKSPPPCGDITPMEVVSNSRAEPQS